LHRLLQPGDGVSRPAVDLRAPRFWAAHDCRWARLSHLQRGRFPLSFPRHTHLPVHPLYDHDCGQRDAVPLADDQERERGAMERTSSQERMTASAWCESVSSPRTLVMQLLDDRLRSEV